MMQRKGTKKSVFLILGVIVAAILLLFAALWIGLRAAMDGDVTSDAYAEQLLDALENDDPESVFETLMAPGYVSRREFDAWFHSAQREWERRGGGPVTALKKISWSWHGSTVNGVRDVTVDCAYRVECGNAVLTLSLTRVEGDRGEGLTWFSLKG